MSYWQGARDDRGVICVILASWKYSAREGVPEISRRGYQDRWSQEFQAIAYSRRVQERVMVKRETRLIDDTQMVIVALSMKGKMKTIFFVWGFGFDFNLTMNLTELFWKK